MESPPPPPTGILDVAQSRNTVCEFLRANRAEEKELPTHLSLLGGRYALNDAEKMSEFHAILGSFLRNVKDDLFPPITENHTIVFPLL